MAEISIQERYEEIAKLSGMSEDIVRRVLKASRQSLAQSLKRGERATLPGICTMIPELRNKLDVGGNSMTSFIKIKTTTSNAMASELDKVNNFENSETDGNSESAVKLNIVGSDTNGVEIKPKGVRTTQIGSLI